MTSESLTSLVNKSGCTGAVSLRAERVPDESQSSKMTMTDKKDKFKLVYPALVESSVRLQESVSVFLKYPKREFVALFLPVSCACTQVSAFLDKDIFLNGPAWS